MTHVDLIRRHAEQPVRLDHLEALVHQRRRIDRDLPPHPPGRMLQRVGRGHVSSALDAARPRNGPPDAVRISRCDLGAVARRAGTGESRCARCRPAGSRRRARRAASVTMPPAITSTSLLASAIVLPCSIAASTASSAVGAGRRAQHDVDVRVRRDRDQAVAAAPATVTRPSTPARGSRSIAAPDAIATRLAAGSARSARRAAPRSRRRRGRRPAADRGARRPPRARSGRSSRSSREWRCAS